jgi:translation elongation factor EF-1alpha
MKVIVAEQTIFLNVWLGQKIVALIEASAPVCVERFADYPQLGRFTLRDEGL